MRKISGIISCILLMGAALMSCASKSGAAASAEQSTPEVEVPAFNADSAYHYVKTQVDFGPRVPNTAAHKATASWLQHTLERHGAKVTLQPMTLTAFDGTKLQAVNIFGQYNPEATDRTLLLAHWDTRPWADEDPDKGNRSRPADGANDGASGVGVLLEVARQLQAQNPGKGIDILFVDAEDWGESSNEESWALGARYFVEHPIVSGYRPTRAILLDMVGGTDAKFYHEYFSMQAAPDLCQRLWSAASEAGYGTRFVGRQGSAVTDDHVQLIAAGIPAVDIIEYRPGVGFNPTWHTMADNMQGISKETLQSVGQTLMQYLYTAE